VNVDTSIPLDDSQQDPARDEVFATLMRADPDGSRAATVFRATYDQLYDGQHTGRYFWEQLYKTEKTHYGTLIEINLRREFDDVIQDGTLLDYQVAGREIDCKFSHQLGSWMLPPECFGQLLLVCTASDALSTWSMGVVRASEEYRRPGANRDGKTGLNSRGREQIAWLHRDRPLPPNVLLHLPTADIEAIFAKRSGQQRLNELFRRATNQRIGRNTVATVAQQDDYMKRVRANGGSRTALADEGYLILGGDYVSHRVIAAQIGATVPEPGEFVSFRVVLASPGYFPCVLLEGEMWRLATEDDVISNPAPLLPAIA
jgi:hypothetical protein